MIDKIILVIVSITLLRSLQNYLDIQRIIDKIMPPPKEDICKCKGKQGMSAIGLCLSCGNHVRDY